MHVVIAGSFQAAEQHVRAFNLATSPVIVLTDEESTQKLRGKKYDRDTTQVWVCNTFWDQNSDNVQAVLEAMSVWTGLRLQDIPCKNIMCGVGL